MNDATETLVPVILAGGGGTRLWPLSRGYYPKQFLALGSDLSLLQQTLLRVAAGGDVELAPTLVVCNEEHRFLVAEQARRIDSPLDTIMLEPAGRNTAPALSAAASYLGRSGDDPIMIMMPADHLVGDGDAFQRAVEAAVQHARNGDVVTFGVVPTHPETGYGYIELGEARAGDSEVAGFSLQAFKEKPDSDTAAAYLASGHYRWNAGIFMMRASVWLAQAQRFCPGIAEHARQAVEAGSSDGDFFRLGKEAFEASPSNSIDYAVMEPLSEHGGAVVVELDAGWSDVGSWSSLWDVSARDESGNVERGDVCQVDGKNNLVFAEHRLVATLGCEDLVVVETADAVMIARKERAQDVKAVVDWLSAQERDERLMHRQVFRPWGSYEGVDAGERFQVKRITVNPGAALSLQMHHHRAEHWIVVSGTAEVTCGDETFLLSENQSTYIPIGATHRLINPGTIPLELIEVQSGSYLGEDDIVRFEDKYQRV